MMALAVVPPCRRNKSGALPWQELLNTFGTELSCLGLLPEKILIERVVIART
jgi:hypothetical protein